MQEKKINSEFWTINKNKDIKNFLYRGQKWIGFPYFFKIIYRLMRQGKSIDLLHLYHIGRYPYILGLAYKISNPKGKIYLKTDVSSKNIHGKSIKCLNPVVGKLFFSLFNYIGCEDKEILFTLRNKVPYLKNRFLFIPSGTIYLREFKEKIFKRNVISLCGRFGDQVKNYELLLEVLEKHDINVFEGWEIQLIGDVSPEFQTRIDEILIKKPKLKEIIRLTGFSNSKTQLFKALSSSKIFIHTAKSEGEPNVQFDAMMCGCYMLSTNVGTIKQNYPKKYSSYFDDNHDSFYKSLCQCLKVTGKLSKEDYNSIQKHCIKNFTWEKSLSPILKNY